MSKPANPDTTALGVTRKIFGGVLAEQRRADLESIDGVLLLACEIVEGEQRRATLVSLDETRAIAALLVDAWGTIFEMLPASLALALAEKIHARGLAEKAARTTKGK